jgi:predicted Zn-dependent protease
MAIIVCGITILSLYFTPVLGQEAQLNGADGTRTPAEETRQSEPEMGNDRVFLKVLKKELDRSMAKFKTAPGAPVYFLAYRVLESETMEVFAKYGALDEDAEPERMRSGQIEIRVGSPELDNSHKSGEDETEDSYVESVTLPIDDDEMAIRQALWRGTERAYRAAQKRIAIVKAKRNVRVQESDRSADFSLESRQEFVDKVKTVDRDWRKYEDVLRRLSAIFNKYPDIQDSSVRLSNATEAHYLVTSEGTEICEAVKSYLVSLYASSVADDGMIVWLYERIEAFGSERQPTESQLTEAVEKLAAQITELRKAPPAEPFVGPAILRGRAAGVFFHEVLGHRLEGHRQKSDSEARTFRDQINREIMPKFISVIDDPSLEKLGDKELSGFYKYDDEGVPAKPVVLVDKGVLKNFLMSRSPIQDFPRSNGHGRCDYGHAPVARQGNLMVIADSSKQVPYDELRRMLIQEVKNQKKAYGLIFDELAGGSTLTHIGQPQLFELYPLVVTKVFADGRPDQMIRGADIVGTPLASLEHIIAPGDDTETFNGVCGAESGWVPVSASSPSLLIKTIEVQRKPKGDEKPPILPAPLLDKSSDRRGIRQ